MNLMNRPNRHWTVARYPVAESSLISNSSNGAHVQIFWSAVNIKNQRATQRAQFAHKATWEEPITPDTQLDIHPRKISSKLEG